MKIDNGLVFVISFFALIFGIFYLENSNTSKELENENKKIRWAFEPEIRCIDGVSYISLPDQFSVKLDKNSKIIPCEIHGE